MLCTRNTALSCIAALWTTGEWETDSLGRNYRRGILKGRHCHKAYEQFLDEDDTPYVGDGTLDLDQQFLDEDDTAYVGDGALDSDQEFVDEQDIHAIVGDAAMHALDQQFLDEDDWAYDGDGALEMDQEFLDEDDTAYDGDNAMDLDQ
ncbi:hypothetical protein DdX_18671 [Ditylenchus destructor]|uniref:Uncharacterized protein n=1 Tax=Ditylenchus destructor TaxID=166010 RepID=A0AAD4MJA0_9BILA|nr:hypothetical protein DdX_18671 [Ditylenchus destructor]